MRCDFAPAAPSLIQQTALLGTGGRVIQSLGKYRLVAPLGRGGMADVYLAVAEGLGGFNKLLVLKSMRETDDPDFLRMFLDEARLCARMHHPNVVQTYEVGQDGDAYFLTMEFINGPTLLRLRALALPEGGLGLPVSLHLISQILSGLDYAHNLKDYSGAPLEVVHRDISPQNVMISVDGECKILDFGIAKVLDSSRHTRTGVFKGKIAYCSPEQVTTQPLDRRSDLFSVGVILWEAIAGVRLWGDLPSGEVLLKVATGEVPSVQSVRPDTPPELAEICNRALARAAADRYATAAELADALDAFAAKLGPPVTRRHIAQLVARLYEPDSARIRALVENHLRPAAEAIPIPLAIDKPATATGLTPRSSPSARAAAAAAAAAAPSPASGAAASAATAATRVLEQPPEDQSSYVVVADRHTTSGPRARRRWPALALTLALVVAVAVTWSSARRSVPHGQAQPPATLAPPPAPVATSATPSTAAAAAPTTPPSPARPLPEPAAAATVKLWVSVIPAGADLTLDGIAIGTAPFRGTYPKDHRAHVVGATMDGFRSMSSQVSFAEDTELELRLVRPAVAAKKKRASSPAQRAPATIAAPPPAADSPAQRPKLEMGDALPAPARPKRTIDLDNPWSKQ
jgi:serine/threonine-protein kinase